MKDFIWKVTLFYFIFLWCVHKIEGLIEEIEATPSNTNAIEMGDLSMPQFVWLTIVFLKFVLLYALGIIPLEIDLGGTFGQGQNFGFFNGRSINSHQINTNKQIELRALVYDCPWQFVCETDFWANQEHKEKSVSFILASIIRNSNATFITPKGRTYGGYGSCEEMYPCPFDVQEAMGVHIPGPGSKSIHKDRKKDSSNDVDVNIDFV